MVIREKALVRQMKQAYKAGGYVVLVRPNGRTMIQTNFWAVEIDNAEVPREVLSLMALHMGFLPQEGEAFRIMKGNKEPSVQELLPEVASEVVDTMNNRLALREDTHPLPMKKTVLTYRGYNVWQEEQTRQIILIDRELEGIFYKLSGIIQIADNLCAWDPVSRVFLMRAVDTASEDALLHLAQKDWNAVT